MKIDCRFTPGSNLSEATEACVFVVVDVLRATSTIVTAFMHGCRSIVPVREVDEAFHLASGTDALIGGERGGLRVDGFDLGNSPREYSAERVDGRVIILTTTNGSRAFRSLPDGAVGLVACFLNLQAVAAFCLKEARDVVIVSSGGEGKFSLEDTACGGGIVHRIREGLRNPSDVTDAAWASEILYRHFQGDLVGMFRATVHGRQLVEIGLEEDLAYCAQVDLTDIVPLYRNGKIELFVSSSSESPSPLLRST